MTTTETLTALAARIDAEATSLHVAIQFDVAEVRRLEGLFGPKVDEQIARTERTIARLRDQRERCIAEVNAIGAAIHALTAVAGV